MLSDHIDTALEKELRGLAPSVRLKTNDLVKRLPFSEATAYKRLLALAPTCPAAEKDKAHSFVRYGRTCYPWTWGQLAPAQKLIEPKARREITETWEDEMTDKIANRVVALLKAGDYIMATIGPETTDPEACILCGVKGQGYVNGICKPCGEQELPDV